MIVVYSSSYDTVHELLVLMAMVSSQGSEVHLHKLAKVFAACMYHKVWMQIDLHQTLDLSLKFGASLLLTWVFYK